MQQGWGVAFRRRRPLGGVQQDAQGRHLRRQLALLKPEVQVPLAPGVVVQAGKQQPPMAAVGHQRQMLAAVAQPAQHLADDAAATTDAQGFAVVQEHRQQGVSRPLPKLARLHRFAGDGAAPPSRGDIAAPRPGARGGIQAADLLQHEGGEGGGVANAVQHPPGLAAQLILHPVAQGFRRILRDRRLPGAVQQQAAVQQVFPTRQADLAFRHRSKVLVHENDGGPVAASARPLRQAHFHGHREHLRISG